MGKSLLRKQLQGDLGQLLSAAPAFGLPSPSVQKPGPRRLGLGPGRGRSHRRSKTRKAEATAGCTGSAELSSHALRRPSHRRPGEDAPQRLRSRRLPAPGPGP